MKLKQFFRPLDASFSTSIAARTLLRSFFVALLLSLFGGLYVYVNSSFDREISKRRGYMSGAILEAQRFFTGHEILLKNLSLSAVRNTRPAPPEAQADSDEFQLVLGQGVHSWSLWQTSRELDYLRSQKINLLYVKAGSALQAERLTQAALNPVAVNQDVLRQLKALEHSQATVTGEHWFNATPNLVMTESSALYCLPCSTSVTRRQAGSDWRSKARIFPRPWTASTRVTLSCSMRGGKKSSPVP